MIKSKTADRPGNGDMRRPFGKKHRIRLKPSFWNYSRSEGHTGIDFKNKWRLLATFTTVMVLIPLFILMAVDARLNLKTLKNQSENQMRLIILSHARILSYELNLQNSEASGYQSIDRLLKQMRTDLNSNLQYDLFLVEPGGRILTDSTFFSGKEGIGRLSFPPAPGNSGIIKDIDTAEFTVTAAYAKLTGSPNVLVLALPDNQVTRLYFSPRIKLLGYLAASILLIIITILGTTTYLIGRIHKADKKRIDTLNRAESANKLAAIGRLASGVAHEINNPLAIINEKTGLVLDLLGDQEESEHRQRLLTLASDVTGAVRRCSRITRRLLDFARHLEPSIEVVSIENIIRQILTFYEKEAERHNINIRLEFSDGIPEFETDKGSLQQIFLNLIENAFDAMKKGGILTISGFYEKDTLTVVVTDTGTGIAKEDRHKIFEPFYTSKSEMWKTGLGLSITYGLLKEINGDIALKSEQGKGSQFILTFPVNSTSKQMES